MADEAFGMSKNLMRPYGGKMLPYEKKIFNYCLTLAPRYVERTFKIDFAENILKVICVLYNYVRIRDGFKYEDTFYTAPLSKLNPSHGP